MGPCDVVNDTLTANSAPGGANVDNESGGTFATQNSIFASPGGGGANCGGTGAFTDNGNNLEDTSPSSCGLTSGNGNLIGQNPQLASALAVNGSTVPTAGGPPQTLALSSTSPALHAASASGCSTVGSVDERTMPRPGQASTACDIGAFELQFHALSVTSNGPGTVTGSGIACPGTCSKTYPEGTQVSLSAQASAGFTFSGWSGDCSGQGGCSVTMNASHSVTATFVGQHPHFARLGERLRFGQRERPVLSPHVLEDLSFGHEGHSPREALFWLRVRWDGAETVAGRRPAA